MKEAGRLIMIKATWTMRTMSKVASLALLWALVGFTARAAEPGWNTGEREDATATLDEIYADIDAQVPGFGGMFLDEAGELNIFLVDPSVRGAALDALAPLLGAKELPTSHMRVLEGTYRYAELEEWNRSLTSVLEIPGVSLTDIDESRNRLRVGLESEEGGEELDRRLMELGIPLDAVLIEVTGPVSLHATLSSAVRPVVGGIQVAFGCSASSCFVCTDGFLAQRGNTLGFVTNSHCSLNQGTTDGTVYSQPFPSANSPKRIGSEAFDRSYFTGGSCPTGRRCRYSDSAFVAKKSKTNYKLGYIARTTGYGSSTISTSNPRFRIISEDPGPLVGEPVEKIGRTTGWSHGTVSRTCTSYNVSGSTVTMLCQDAVTGTSSSGDSGSPVFRVRRGKDVSLDGILWGGSGGTYLFSRLANIQRGDELGDLRVVAP
jgi:hypothetical protein